MARWAVAPSLLGFRRAVVADPAGIEHSKSRTPAARPGFVFPPRQASRLPGIGNSAIRKLAAEVGPCPPGVLEIGFRRSGRGPATARKLRQGMRFSRRFRAPEDGCLGEIDVFSPLPVRRPTTARPVSGFILPPSSFILQFSDLLHQLLQIRHNEDIFVHLPVADHAFSVEQEHGAVGKMALIEDFIAPHHG